MPIPYSLRSRGVVDHLDHKVGIVRGTDLTQQPHSVGLPVMSAVPHGVGHVSPLIPQCDHLVVVHAAVNTDRRLSSEDVPGEQRVKGIRSIRRRDWSRVEWPHLSVRECTTSMSHTALPPSYPPCR